MANPQTDTRVYPADFLPQLQQALGTEANRGFALGELTHMNQKHDRSAQHAPSAIDYCQTSTCFATS